MSEPLGGSIWEAVNLFRHLDRIRVPGGWIYRATHEHAVALCFVPLAPEDTVSPAMPLDNTTQPAP